MKVETPQFAEVEFEEEDVLFFPEGLVGLSGHKRFLLLQDPESEELFWLQSVDQQQFALAMVHSSKVGGEYKIEVHKEEIEDLKLSDISEAEIFLILNRVDGQMCVNLRGPLIVNANLMLGKQVVLNDPSYDIRHPLEPISSSEPTHKIAANG